MFPLAVLGQGIEGMVLDSSTSNGIPFALVELIDLNVSAIADEHGHFQISHSIPYPIKLRCSALGYQGVIAQFNAEEVKAGIEVYLLTAHIELDEVNIAVGSGLHQRFNMSNVESKSIEELSAIVSPNLSEALTNLGSVYNNSTGNGIGKPVIRGLSGSRVVTALNGLRIENQQWGGDHGLGVSELGIDQVDLIKGPASLMYGADALGGVIHLSDEKYTAPGNIESFISSQFETNSLLSKNQIGLKLARTQLRMNVYAYYLSAADYQLPDGDYADNSRWQEGALKAAIGYNRKNWVLNARYNYNRSFLGIPGHTHDSVINPTAFRVKDQQRAWTLPVQQINSHFVLIENAFYFENSDLKIFTGLTANNLKELEDKVTIPGIHNQQNTYSYNLRYRNMLGKTHQLVGGIQGQWQVNSNLQGAEEELIPNAKLWDNGAYLLWNWNKKTVETQLGARYDRRDLNAEGQIFTYNSFNGSAGLVKQVRPFTSRVNISTGYRPPNLSELLSDGVHHGSLRYELGSSTLQAEWARQFDLSLEWEGAHLGLIANPFINLIDNFIYMQEIDSTINSYQVFEYRQTQRALLTGGAFGFHYHPHFLHQLHLESTLSYLYTENELGQSLSFIPQTRINTTAKLQFKRKGLVQLENIHLQYLYFFAQNKVSTLETASPSYQLLHLGTQLKINWKHPLQIKLGVRNLFNQNYIDHLSRLKNIALEAPGRNFYVCLQWRIIKPKNLHPDENKD